MNTFDKFFSQITETAKNDDFNPFENTPKPKKGNIIIVDDTENKQINTPNKSPTKPHQKR